MVGAQPCIPSAAIAPELSPFGVCCDEVSGVNRVFRDRRFPIRVQIVKLTFLKQLLEGISENKNQ